MSEWSTYQLSDLILFSSHTYYRLIELYNAAIWPLQLISLVINFCVIALVWRRPLWHGKAIAIILTLSWLWVAWGFHWQRFATIHWVAAYFALTFAIQAMFFIWVGVIKNRLVIGTVKSPQQYTGLSILVFAFFIQPFMMMLAGHSWKQAELFGITPDPTIVATIGLLLLTNIRKHWWLMIIPVLWCFISAATLWVLNSSNAFVMLVTAISAILFVSLFPHRYH